MNQLIEDIQVIGLGQACVDYLGRIPSYPQEDGKVELMDLHMQCGGPASTALVTLSRMGVKTCFLGSISDDPLGLEILRELKEEDVDSTYLKITPHFTSQFAFIAINKEDGKRTIFWHRGTVPPLKASDVNLPPFPNARILHLDGLMIEASAEAARQAKTRGMTVVMDAGTMRGGSKGLVSLVDVLVASETFVTPLVGSDVSPETSLHALRDLGPRQVVITRGAKGSIGLNDSGIVRQKAFPVRAVDTTGAGDVYHGAYIYGLLEGWDMSECMRFASATSAIKCKAIGARKGIPNVEEVKEFMKNFPTV
ncbi:MAG: PfkB family carbohydrate kinase [Desulfatiglandales bacterium]